MQKTLLGLVLCIALLLTTPALAADWPSTPREAFGDARLEVLDTGKQAVALITKFEPRPPAPSMLLIPEFHSADGEVVGRLSCNTMQELENRYKSAHGSEDGFTLFLVNLYNDYRGLPQVTPRDMEEYHQRLQRASAGAAAARDARQRTDLGGLTHEQLFQEIDIAILDRKTPAEDIGSFEWSLRTMNSFDENNNILGSISAEDYLTILERATRHYEMLLNQMPGGSGIVYAQLFSNARGVRRATVEEYLAYCGVNGANLNSDNWANLGKLFQLPPHSVTTGGSENTPTMVDASGFPALLAIL